MAFVTRRPFIPELQPGYVDPWAPALPAAPSPYQLPGWGNDLSQSGLGVSWTPGDGSTAPAAPAAPRPPAFNFNTDPGYVAALAGERTGRESLDALLRRRRAEALIGFGDPDWAAASGFGLDPNSIEAARALSKAGLSTLSQLEKGRDQRRSAVINRLAGSGMLFSGETGYQERENEAMFGRERYDAQQGVLRQLAGEQESTLSQQQQLRNAVVQALQQAYSNYLGNPYLYSGVD